MEVHMTADYPQNSDLQQSMMSKCIEKVTSSIIGIHKKDTERFSRSSEPFTLVDLGSASGKNSIPVYKVVIETVRKLNADLPISIFLNDLPECSFTEGFHYCQKELSHYGKVFFFAVGKSFYELLFPSRSVDLYICFASITWLTKLPSVRDSFFHYVTEENIETEDMQKWIKQAHKDWVLFLNMREKEIKPNGAIVVSTKSSPIELREEEKKWINTNKICKGAMVSVLKRYGLEQYDTCMPSFLRQREQYLQPFKDKETTLNVKSYDECITNVGFGQEFKADRNEDKYIDKLAAWFRAISKDCMTAAMLIAGADIDKTSRAMTDVYLEFAKCKEELVQNAVEDFTQVIIVIESNNIN